MDPVFHHLSVLKQSVDAFLHSTSFIPASHQVSRYSYADHSSRESHNTYLREALDTSLAIIAKLDPLLARLTATRDQYHHSTRTLFNSIYPSMLALPDEIAGSIFEHVVAQSVSDSRQTDYHPSRYVKQIHTLGQICSRWRRIALSWPRLWTHLFLADLSSNRFNTWVERSRPMPLSVVVQDRSLRALSKVVPRIHHLELDPSQQFIMNPQFIDPCFDLLQTLIIAGSCTFNPFLWPMPFLQNLEIRDTSSSFLVERGSLGQVRVLSLRRIPQGVQWDQFLYAFEGSKSLEELRLTALRLPPRVVEGLLPVMNRIKHFHSSMLHQDILTYILPRALGPALQSLTFISYTLYYIPEMLGPLLIDFLERTPLLRSLTLTVSIIPDEHDPARFFSLFAAALRASERRLLPNLQDLYLYMYPRDELYRAEEAIYDFFNSLWERSGTLPVQSLSRHIPSVSTLMPLSALEEGWHEAKVGDVRLMLGVYSQGLQGDEPPCSIPDFEPRLYDDRW